MLIMFTKNVVVDIYYVVSKSFLTRTLQNSSSIARQAEIHSSSYLRERKRHDD